MDAEDHYTRFGIPVDAEAADIGKVLDREQRKWAARTNAPALADRRRAEDMLEAAQQARTDLLDPARRAAYDAQLAARRATGGERPEPHAQSQPQPRSESRSQSRDWLAEARRLRDAGDLPGAVYEARQAVHFDDANATAWLLLGRLHWESGDRTDCVQEFQRAAKLAPHNPSAHRWLGDVARERGDHDDALAHYSTALSLAPGHAATRRQFAYCLASVGRVQEALDHYAALLEAAPNDAGLRNQTARLLWSTGTGGVPRFKNGDPSITAAEHAHAILSAADTVARLQPTDQNLAARVSDDVAAARRALKVVWRWRPAVILAVLGTVVVFGLIDAIPRTNEGLVGAVAWSAVLGAVIAVGRKPRWWHEARQNNKPRQRSSGSFARNRRRG